MFIRRFINRHESIKYLIKNLLGKGIIENVLNTNFNKNCLMMYMVYPFEKPELDNIHQANWQEKQIAKLLCERKYNVDIIDYNNKSVFLKKNYDLVIDLIPGNNSVFRKHMNPDCKTIAYFTGSNARFQNDAEKQRLSELKDRRGAEILPRRQAPYLTRAIEKYDACFMIGNTYNWRTYDEFNMPPVYFIKNTGHESEYVFNKKKKKKNSFLYFGSVGQVHKGLDLLLEVFSKNILACELYVCGNFKKEPDFEKEYYYELYKCPNIHPIGFVDITSEKFKRLTDICVFSILPSCSEANAGSVLTTMSVGLIPICSYECGFEDDEVIHLKNCSLNTIREAILKYSKKDDEWILQESRHAYNIVQQRYSKQDFVNSIKYALDKVL